MFKIQRQFHFNFTNTNVEEVMSDTVAVELVETDSQTMGMV